LLKEFAHARKRPLRIILVGALAVQYYGLSDRARKYLMLSFRTFKLKYGTGTENLPKNNNGAHLRERSLPFFSLLLLLPVSVCVQPDLTKLKESAKRKDAEAQYQLGKMYSDGCGVEQS